MSLAENIYRFRTEQNMSQLDLADALEVSRQSVSKWETGAAVPELDKLIKMSKLFGVTLDELVSGEAPTPKEEPVQEIPPEPKVIYIEKPVFPTVKRQFLMGGVILFCAFVYSLTLYNDQLPMPYCLLLILPILGCGIVYLLTNHPLYYCGWFATGAYWTHFLILFHRWEEHTPLIILGVALVIFMVLLTLHLRKTGILRIPFGVMLLGSIVLILLFILLCINCISFSLFTTSEASSIPVPK